MRGLGTLNNLLVSPTGMGQHLDVVTPEREGASCVCVLSTYCVLSTVRAHRVRFLTRAAQ